MKKKNLTWLFLFATLFILDGCFTTTSDPTPGGNNNNKTPEPVPSFTYITGDDGNVSFINFSTDATSYQWDFGDQSYSQQSDPEHKYSANGAYRVTLTATGDGGSKSVSNTIAINNVKGSITFKNTTRTDISITINSQTLVATPGNSVTFIGTPGASAIGSALTFGATSTGEPIGLQLTFDLNYTFESPGSTINLGISGDFFFLRVKNTWSYPITTVYVNYGLVGQTVDYITIPNDGQIYDLGYYQNFSNSNVRFEYGDQFWYSNIYPSFETNSVGLVEVQ